MNDSQTKTVQDVVDILKDVYGMDIRWKGKTISYALPYDLNKGGKTKAVRGSKLGKTIYRGGDGTVSTGKGTQALGVSANRLGN